MPRALFRGASSCPDFNCSDWRACPRVTAALLALQHPDTMDVRVLGARCGPEAAYAGGQVIPYMDWGHWRYLVDIEGSTCGDSINRRLVTGSLVIHLDNTRGYREFYQPLMFAASPPSLRFVAAVAELPAAVAWAVGHDAEAAAMGGRAEAFMRAYVYPPCSRQAYVRTGPRVPCCVIC